MPGVGAMLRAWLSGSTSPLAPWWIIYGDYGVYILDMADTLTHGLSPIFMILHIYICTVYMYKCVCVLLRIRGFQFSGEIPLYNLFVFLTHLL